MHFRLDPALEECRFHLQTASSQHALSSQHRYGVAGMPSSLNDSSTSIALSLCSFSANDYNPKRLADFLLNKHRRLLAGGNITVKCPTDVTVRELAAVMVCSPFLNPRGKMLIRGEKYGVTGSSKITLDAWFVFTTISYALQNSWTEEVFPWCAVQLKIRIVSSNYIKYFKFFQMYQFCTKNVWKQPCPRQPITVMDYLSDEKTNLIKISCTKRKLRNRTLVTGHAVTDILPILAEIEPTRNAAWIIVRVLSAWSRFRTSSGLLSQQTAWPRLDARAKLSRVRLGSAVRLWKHEYRNIEDE